MDDGETRLGGGKEGELCLSAGGIMFLMIGTCRQSSVEPSAIHSAKMGKCKVLEAALYI